MFTCLTLFIFNAILCAYNDYYSMDNEQDNAHKNLFYKRFIDDTHTRINVFIDSITATQMQTQQKENNEFGSDLQNIEIHLLKIEKLIHQNNYVGAGFHTQDVKNSIDEITQKIKQLHNKNTKILNELSINNIIKNNAIQIFLAELEMHILNEQRYIGVFHALTEKTKRFSKAVDCICDKINKNYKSVGHDANYQNLLGLQNILKEITGNNSPQFLLTMNALKEQFEKCKNELRRGDEY